MLHENIFLEQGAEQGTKWLIASHALSSTLLTLFQSQGRISTIENIPQQLHDQRGVNGTGQVCDQMGRDNREFWEGKSSGYFG